jgi:thymidine phosphorylase
MDARRKLETAISTGAAAEHFERMVASLGGPRDLIDRSPAYLPRAPIVRSVFASSPGRVSSIDTRALGLAVIRLGGGRSHPDAKIDHAVGLTDLAAKNAEVGPDRPLATIHARDDAAAAAAAEMLRSAYRCGDGTTETPVILERIA